MGSQKNDRKPRSTRSDLFSNVNLQSFYQIHTICESEWGFFSSAKMAKKLFSYVLAS